MADSSWTVLADALDDCLPQTQCGQCGHNGCRPYAEAMARGEAPINRCPPGGQQGVEQLARIMSQPVIPLDPDYGPTKPRLIADIQAEHCIGCTLCIRACPVDAIIGANKRRHSVIAALCTGCELCIPPCPVDCITLHPVDGHTGWTRQDAHAARSRMQQRNIRLIRKADENRERLEAKALHKRDHLTEETRGADNTDEAARKRSVIEAALQRARERRGEKRPSTP